MATSIELTLPNGTRYSQPTGLFINNEYVKAKSGRTFASVDPATGKDICSVHEADESDIDAAVVAARYV